MLVIDTACPSCGMYTRSIVYVREMNTKIIHCFICGSSLMARKGRVYSPTFNDTGVEGISGMYNGL